jgi:hypothetical protein
LFRRCAADAFPLLPPPHNLAFSPRPLTTPTTHTLTHPRRGSGWISSRA